MSKNKVVQQSLGGPALYANPSKHPKKEKPMTNADNTVEKNIPTTIGWELVPSADGSIGEIRIMDQYLREFIFYETNSHLISEQTLVNENDSEFTIRIKNRKSLIPLNAAYGHVSNAYGSLQKKNEEDFGDYPLLPSTYQDFLTFVEESYTGGINAAIDSFKAGSVTFKQLEIAMNNGQRAYSMKNDGYLIGFICKGAMIRKSMFRGIYLEIIAEVYFSDGYQVGSSNIELSISEFQGSVSPASLGLTLLESSPKIKEQLVARGRRYLELVTKPVYMFYKGVITSKIEYRTYKANATGRVVIDRAGMGKFRPNYSNYYGGYSDFDDEDSFKPDSPNITEDFLALMPPVVYGFSFVSKIWGEMDVENFSPIQFRKDAFDQLQLPLPTKKLLSALVEGTRGGDEDIISGKGGGCIVLLAGPPGTGKTSSAEVMAERLQRPLYMVNIGELGTTAEDLEESLQSVLDTATSWNALLLIDEADIFLEERSDNDIERNAMVAIFLRLLEYYQGILFLTTNRVSRIDQAFYSRIHMALHYKNLTEVDRLAVWTNLLSISGVKEVDPVPLSKLSLNGRQIKNCIANAKALAKYENHVVTADHFKVVIDRINDFEEVLKK